MRQASIETCGKPPVDLLMDVYLVSAPLPTRMLIGPRWRSRV
jgi:hypothetical protein